MNKDFSPEEADFIKKLGPMDMSEDFIDWLENMEPHPTEESLERIKLCSLKQVRADAMNRSRKWQAAAAVVLLGTALSFFAIGPGKVVAEIVKLLYYVPGFDSQIMEEKNFLSATQPVVVKNGDQMLEVMGMVSDSSNTYLHIRMNKVGITRDNWKDKMQLKDPVGRLVPAKSGSWSSGGNNTEGWFTFAPLASNSRAVTVLISGYPELSARVYLVQSDNLMGLDEVGISAAAQGIKITAVPELREESLIVNLLFQNAPGARVNSIGDAPFTQAELHGPNGIFSLLENHRTDLKFAITGPEPEMMKLIIPELVVAEQEKPVKLKIPIPAAGQSIALDTKLALGRHTLLIKRIERLNNSLRIYLDSQSPAGWKLSWFYLEEWESAWSSRVLSYCGQRDEITRKIQYFEVDLDELKRQENYVVLMLKNPDSIVQGPWEFNIDKNRIMNHGT